MKNSRELFIGVIAAATAGVIIGMLIAPEKGEDLRRTIRNTVGDWSKKVKDIMAEASDLVAETKEVVLEEGKKEISEQGRKRSF